MNSHGSGCYGALKPVVCVVFPSCSAPWWPSWETWTSRCRRTPSKGSTRTSGWVRCEENESQKNSAGCFCRKKKIAPLVFPHFSFVLDARKKQNKSLSCVHCGCADCLWLLCRPGWLGGGGGEGGGGGGGRGWDVAPGSKGPIGMPGSSSQKAAQWRLHNHLLRLRKSIRTAWNFLGIMIQYWYKFSLSHVSDLFVCLFVLENDSLVSSRFRSRFQDNTICLPDSVTTQSVLTAGCNSAATANQ